MAAVDFTTLGWVDGVRIVARAWQPVSRRPPRSNSGCSSSSIVERDARGIAPLELHPVLSEIARELQRRMASDRSKVDHERGRPWRSGSCDAVPNTCMFGENVSKNTSVDYA